MNYTTAVLGHLAICLHVISVCLHVFIIAPAVCLRLTCMPEHYVKWVWPKKLPCGCALLCLLAAGMRTLGDEPLPTLAICQRPCTAPWVRSPGKECQAKITGRTHTHTCTQTGSHKHVHLTDSTHTSCSSTCSNCWGWWNWRGCRW